MMMSQSLVRNLLVLFALCALLIQAAPVKVRRSRISSGRDELPRLPRRSPVIKQAFAPARLFKRQSGTTSTSATTFTIVLQTTLSSSSSKAFKSATSSAPTSTATGVSVSVSTATVTQTATVTVTSSAVPGTSNAAASTSFAITASTPPVVPVSAPPTGGIPANKLATATGATSTGTDATGTTVTVSVDSLPTPNSSFGLGSTSTQSAGSCKETTIFNKSELHANPQVDITLWKAVPDMQDAVTALISNPIPPRNEKGDFNANGAFYVTDTWQAAAQAACYASGKQIDNVAVIQYQWTPQADTKIVEFESQNTRWQAFVDRKNDQSILSADMIAGPMTLTKDITTSFWQYALNSDAALQNLALAAVYQPIQCSNIPRGNCLPVMV